MRGEHAVIEDQIDPRPRRQRGQPREKVQGLEHEMGGAVPPRSLQLEHHATLPTEPEPILGNGRAEEIAAELLESLPILSPHSDVGVQVEAVEMRVPGPTGRGPVRLRVPPEGQQPRARPFPQRHPPLRRASSPARQVRCLRLSLPAHRRSEPRNLYYPSIPSPTIERTHGRAPASEDANPASFS
jgi:hypothetical protein